MMSYPSGQRGQALLAMLAFIIVLAIAMVYLFNTSQLLSERAQAKVLADHAAYNTAVKQAQLLNANAYMNKAKIANQLAVAQAVSVASWAKHFEPMPQNTSPINILPYAGSAIHQGITYTANFMQGVALTQSPYVYANGLATGIISTNQKLLNNVSTPTIIKEPDQIIEKSSIGKEFESAPLYASSQFGFQNPLGTDFIDKYSGSSQDPYEGRIRMRNILLNARDSFTQNRTKNKQTSNFIPIWRYDLRFQMRSGTELSGDMNQWKGIDTLSLHYKRPGRWGKTRRTEYAIGYGSTVARKNSSDNDPNNRAGYSSARDVNGKATNRASQNRPNWDARSSSFLHQGFPPPEYGVPEYWDLSKEFLMQSEPHMDISIKVAKSKNKLNTTSGISNFKAGDEIDIKSKNDLMAISTAQVYFERPIINSQGQSTYFNSGKYEKASLFNPYWNVRLTDNSNQSIIEANVRQ